MTDEQVREGSDTEYIPARGLAGAALASTPEARSHEGIAMTLFLWQAGSGVIIGATGRLLLGRSAASFIASLTMAAVVSTILAMSAP